MNVSIEFVHFVLIKGSFFWDIDPTSLFHLLKPWPNIIEVFKQQIMLNRYPLSKNEHRSQVVHETGILAGNLTPVSTILFCLAVFVLVTKQNNSSYRGKVTCQKNNLYLKSCT